MFYVKRNDGRKKEPSAAVPARKRFSRRPPLCPVLRARGVSPSHRHRVRAVGFRSRARGVFGAPQPAQEGKMFRPRARGVFSLVALRLPARLCPAPVRDIRRWRGTSKSSAFCPAPVRDNVLFSPQHGIAAARQRRFPVRRIFNPRAALVPPRARLFAARPHPRPFS